MADPKPTKQTKGHTIYRNKDNVRLPSSTTITGLLAKPVLINWANRMGLEGIDTNKYVNMKADVGTCCHYMIECHLKGEEPDFSDFSPNAVKSANDGYQKYLNWEKSLGGLTMIGSEMPLVSEEFQFGGTCDIYGTIGSGEKVLVDIKTSDSGIWPENRYQVASYWKLLIENEYPVDRVFILRVGQDDEMQNFDDEEQRLLDKNFEVFAALLKVHYAIKALKAA